MPLAFPDTDILTLSKERVSLLYSQSQELNQRAQGYITLMTGALALVGAFNAFKRAHDALDIILLVVLVSAYAFGVLIALRVSSYSDWEHPVDINQFSAIRGSRSQAFDDEVWMQARLKIYAYAYNRNLKIIADKLRRVWWAYFCTMVVFITALVLIAR